MEKHTMVIEYIGELIRNEVANRREQLYQQQVENDLPYQEILNTRLNVT
jgi:hypothetical protein